MTYLAILSAYTIILTNHPAAYAAFFVAAAFAWTED